MLKLWSSDDADIFIPVPMRIRNDTPDPDLSLSMEGSFSLDSLSLICFVDSSGTKKLLRDKIG